jgi:hypothetical protein
LACQGIIPINGVLTKHFFREELEVMLSGYGFKMLITEKIEYPWTSELDAPPRWMRAPYPWDWFVVARRQR